MHLQAHLHLLFLLPDVATAQFPLSKTCRVLQTSLRRRDISTIGATDFTSECVVIVAKLESNAGYRMVGPVVAFDPAYTHGLVPW